MVEESGHMKVINVFYDVNRILYTITNIYPQNGILLKCRQCFFVVKTEPYLR